MAQRDVTYTSTTVSKDHVKYIDELKKYAKENHGVVLTSQQVNDFALETAIKYKAELRAFVAENIKDPEVEAYLKLHAKLKAAGKLPK